MDDLSTSCPFDRYKFFPELVTKADMEKVKDARGVDYARFTAVLLEAVKELRKQNIAPQKRLDKLEKLTNPEKAN